MNQSKIFEPANSKKGANFSKEIYYIGVLAVLVVLGNLPLFFGKTYQDLYAFNNDYFLGIIYGYNELGSSLRHGNFLLWGTSMGSGEPELSFYVGAFVYPFSLIFGLFKFPWRIIFFCVAHLELVGMMSFLVFRRLGVSRPSALIVAGWNAMSGYTTWISEIPHIIALLPWFYLIIFLMLKPKGLAQAKNFALLVFAFAMMILSGDAEQMVYAAYFGGFFLICFWAAAKEKFSLKIAALILIGLCLASVVCLDQIFPFLNYISRSVRSERLPFQQYVSSYLNASEIMKGLIGIFSRKFVNLYFSFFAFAFAIWGIFGRGSAARSAALATIIVVSLLLLMPSIGLGKIVYSIPLYFHFIHHYKLGFILQFLVLLLAGIGLDRFLALLVSGKKELRTALLSLSIFIAGGFALSIFNIMLLLPLALVVLIGIFPWVRSRPAVVLGLLLIMDIYPYLWHPPYDFFNSKCRNMVQAMNALPKQPGVITAWRCFIRRLAC